MHSDVHIFVRDLDINIQENNNNIFNIILVDRNLIMLEKDIINIQFYLIQALL